MAPDRVNWPPTLSTGGCECSHEVLAFLGASRHRVGFSSRFTQSRSAAFCPGHRPTQDRSLRWN
jgi:hypothetical protein